MTIFLTDYQRINADAKFKKDKKQVRGKHLELQRNNDINAAKCSLLLDTFSRGYGKKSLGLSRVKSVAVGYKNVRFVHYWRMLYAGRFFQ